jgi:hypothetical protein
MLAGDRVSGTDADRHEDISHNGSSEFRGNADSAEMADLGRVTHYRRSQRLVATAAERRKLRLILRVSLLLVQPSLHLLKVQLVCINSPSNMSFNSSNMSPIHWGAS